MGDKVTLRHYRFKTPQKIVYFYDGMEVAYNGLLTISTANRPWIERAWRLLGYNQTPEGKPILTVQELDAEIAKQTAESAKGKNESSDSRRQPTSKNRVRES